MSSPGRDFLNRHTYGGPECKDLYGQDVVDAFQKVKDLFGHDARIVDARGLAAAIDTLLDKNARQRLALDLLERKFPTEVRGALQATVNVTDGNYSEYRIALEQPENPLLSEYRIHHLRIIPPTLQGHPQDGVTKVQAIKELRAASGLGLKDAKDLVETIMYSPKGHTASLSIRDLSAFAKAMATLGFMVIGENGVTVPVATPPQDSQTFFNVRIRWMKWTGKAPEMQDLIKTHTDKDGSIQHINDAIHSGGVGGCGAVFPKITIRDFATFCRKAEEYGYEVELVEAPVAEEANPFVVRAPV